MNNHPLPDNKKENSGTSALRALQQQIDLALDLPSEDAALALDLLTLSERTHPDDEFVTRLDGELTRKRRASRPRSAQPPTLAERLRGVLDFAWGWALPAGAVIGLILVISLLVQMRPRQTGFSAEITATNPTARAATRTPLVTSTPVGFLYEVQEDDILASIAQHFGVTEEAILEANNLKRGDLIRVGQSLIIPQPYAGLPMSDINYVVGEGDTLASIASQFGMTVEELRELNNLSPEATLQVGQVLIIPLEEATVTATPMTAAPTPDAQTSLAEIQNLVEKRRAALLTGPGWIYHQYRTSTTTECGGVMLPLGLFFPCDLDKYVWSELNERGEVVTTITRELDLSGNVFQEYITKDSIGRNFTFGYEYTTTLTDTYSTDWGFAALAAEAVADGELLTRLSPSAGEADNGPVVYMIWADGVLQREATFDPQSGALLAVVIYTPNTRGQDNYEIATIMTEERIDQPPAEALALLDQPLQPYQAQPPQGDPLPLGFDLANSTLSLQNIAGDDFNNPNLWYGDIYADGSYLVGRVDFGGIAGGLCQRSPDGLKLAFNYMGYANDSSTLLQLRWLDLSALSDVHLPSFELQLLSPAAWGPDSTRLAFVACDAANSCGLYTYDTLSGALKLLRPAGNANGAPAPVWSADGVEIAFRANQDASSPVVVVDAASGMVNPSPAWQPQFSNATGFSQCELPPTLAPTD